MVFSFILRCVILSGLNLFASQIALSLEFKVSWESFCYFMLNLDVLRYSSFAKMYKNCDPFFLFFYFQNVELQLLVCLDAYQYHRD